MCAFLTYFIMSGYQFKQAQAVLLKRVCVLQRAKCFPKKDVKFLHAERAKTEIGRPPVDD